MLGHVNFGVLRGSELRITIVNSVGRKVLFRLSPVSFGLEERFYVLTIVTGPCRLCCAGLEGKLLVVL